MLYLESRPRHRCRLCDAISAGSTGKGQLMTETTLAAANVKIVHDKARNMKRFVELIEEAAGKAPTFWCCRRPGCRAMRISRSAWLQGRRRAEAVLLPRSRDDPRTRDRADGGTRAPPRHADPDRPRRAGAARQRHLQFHGAGRSRRGDRRLPQAAQHVRVPLFLARRGDAGLPDAARHALEHHLLRSLLPRTAAHLCDQRRRCRADVDRMADEGA